jgi:hypothetical protein
MSVISGPSEIIDVPDTRYAGEQPLEGTLDNDPDHFFETIYRTQEPLRQSKLPPLVLYGNSFVDPYIESGMYFQFAEVYRVRSNGIPVEAMLLHIPPSTRYVVVQFLEAYLGEFLGYRIPSE